MFTPTLVLIDDEQAILDAYEFSLRVAGFDTIEKISDSRTVLARLSGIVDPIVMLDLNMPYKNGIEVLGEIKAVHPDTPVIICTANNETTTAVACLKLGAHDYLLKPIDAEKMESAVRTAIEILRLRKEVTSLHTAAFSKTYENKEAFSHIITQDETLFSLFRYIEQVAGSGHPVMLLGETGSGKELFARAVHNASGCSGAFVAIDVSGLDDNMFADTLFGHAKGAYTGADKVRSGLIEQAENGTLFLDEIGDLTEPSQIKLLRLLQEGIYYPLGSDQPKRSKARIVAAANKNLQELVGTYGEFRKDLFYRLSTHMVRIPPLRERTKDIPLLVEYFLQESSQQSGKPVPSVTPSLMSRLQSHPFPGNVRELRAYILEAAALCVGDTLPEQSIIDRMLMQGEIECGQKEATLECIFGGFPTLDEVVEYTVQQALERSDNNQTKAAKLLGITKQALSGRLKRRGE